MAVKKAKQQNKSELIRVIIVDDEIESCWNLKNILESYIDNSKLEIVGMAHNTQEAEQLINELKPNALLLDIEMPNENAFQFLDRIAPFQFEIIFVTAYDEFAIKAFKLNALDYILKPISISELEMAVQKLINRIESNKILNKQGSYSDLSDDFTNRTNSNYLKLRTFNSIDIVFFENILFIEAQGSYSKFYFITDNAVKDVIMSHTVSDYEELLPKDYFFRVHRSYLINRSHIKRIQLEENSLLMTNTKFDIPISRRRISEFLDFINQNDTK